MNYDHSTIFEIIIRADESFAHKLRTLQIIEKLNKLVRFNTTN